MLGAPVDEHVVGELDPVPALVSVHRVVAPNHRADPARAELVHPPLDRRQVAGARIGERVAPVGERVEHEVRDAEFSREADERLDVGPAGVHAAVGHEPDQVDPLGAGEGATEDLIRAELAVLDREVDPGEVLHDHRAGAEVEVADLGVAHLALGQADGAPARGQLGVRIALPERIEHRRGRERNRVPGPRLGDAPPIENDERRTGRRQCIGPGRQRAHGPVAPPAALTIAANDSASRLAPPTRAPSMSGNASSSAALSALTLPP